MWTRLLQVKRVVNGRLIMVETKMACYYGYIIFPGEVQDFSDESKLVRSELKYNHWKEAVGAAKLALGCK